MTRTRLAVVVVSALVVAVAAAWAGPGVLRGAGVTTRVTQEDEVAWRDLVAEVDAVGVPPGSQIDHDVRVGPCEGESGQSLEVYQGFGSEKAEDGVESYFNTMLNDRGWEVAKRPDGVLVATKEIGGLPGRFFLSAEGAAFDVSYGVTGSSSCGLLG